MRTDLTPRKAERVAKKVAAPKIINSLKHAAGYVRLVAQRSMRTMPKKKRRGETKKLRGSPPGTPPYRGTGQLRKSIIYHEEKGKQRYVIGPAWSKIIGIGAIHEFGGRFRGRKYPRRPFMEPALKKARERMATHLRM